MASTLKAAKPSKEKIENATSATQIQFPCAYVQRCGYNYRATASSSAEHGPDVGMNEDSTVTGSCRPPVSFVTEVGKWNEAAQYKRKHGVLVKTNECSPEELDWIPVSTTVAMLCWTTH